MCCQHAERVRLFDPADPDGRIPDGSMAGKYMRFSRSSWSKPLPVCPWVVVENPGFDPYTTGLWVGTMNLVAAWPVSWWGLHTQPLAWSYGSHARRANLRISPPGLRVKALSSFELRRGVPLAVGFDP